MSLVIEPLCRSHRPLLADFQNPRAELVDYLQRYALRHLEKDLLARTYVAIDSGDGTRRLAGYFSLTTVSVERDSVAAIAALDRLPRFPIPDSRFQQFSWHGSQSIAASAAKDWGAICSKKH